MDTIKLIKILSEKKLTVSTAESCTGGMAAQKITAIPGASEVFKYGAVTYANETKEKVLGVKKETLEKYGAVSHETAREMAEGVRETMEADIGISITGCAGPSPTEGKAIGLCYIGVSSDVGTFSIENHFPGSRDDIRLAATDKALSLCYEEALKL